MIRRKERFRIYVLRSATVLFICIFYLFFVLAYLRHEYDVHLSKKNVQMEEENVVRDLRTRCEIPPLSRIEQFFNYLDNVKNDLCSNMSSVGGVYNEDIFDGNKFICFDEKYKFVHGNCHVLSFGINNEWSFDLLMDQVLGCKVFAFDPTMGFEDFWKTKRIRFLNLGIANYEGLRMFDELEAKVDRYEGIIYRLGLQNTEIDYLKMDVEGTEVEFFEDILSSTFYLLKKVKQIGVEIHLGGNLDQRSSSIENDTLLKSLWSLFFRMECSGFKMVSASMNKHPKNFVTLNGRVRSSCYEILWIRI